MNAVIFSFTRAGTLLGMRVVSVLEQAGWHVAAKSYGKYIGAGEMVQPMDSPLRDEVNLAFHHSQCLVFIGAAGIAVRAIAPYVHSKTTDPAVLVLDEQGQFVIPLLSGHMGGANTLARSIASQLGAQPVVTTATDVNHVFAVDEWAAAHHLVLTSLTDAKAFAAAILVQKEAGLYSDFPITGTLPVSLHKAGTGTVGVAAALRCDCHPFRTTVVVQPRIFHLGIGCRAGIAEGAVQTAVHAALREAAVTEEAVVAVHSLALKAEEPGLVSFCAHHKWPFSTFDVPTLAAVPGYFTGSSFVRRTVGVDNVCERAAVAGTHGGTLVLRKFACDGVTVAIAYEPYTLSFT